MKTLMKRTEVYRVEDEAAAVEMINDAREESLSSDYTLTKSSYALKVKKAKGEIIDSFALVTLEKTFGE